SRPCGVISWAYSVSAWAITARPPGIRMVAFEGEACPRNWRYTSMDANTYRAVAGKPKARAGVIGSMVVFREKPPKSGTAAPAFEAFAMTAEGCLPYNRALSPFSGPEGGHPIQEVDDHVRESHRAPGPVAEEPGRPGTAQRGQYSRYSARGTQGPAGSRCGVAGGQGIRRTGQREGSGAGSPAKPEPWP